MDLAKLNIEINSSQAKTATTNLDRLTASGKKTEKQVKETSKSADRLQKSFSRVNKSALRLKSALVGLGIGLVLRKSLSEFSSFNKGLIAVQKTTGLTDIEIKVLGKSIKDMSFEVPVTTTKLLELAEAAGQLGVKGSDNIRIFTKTMGQLETASDVAGEEGAKAVARLLNVTNEAISTVPRFASVLVALGNNSAASEREILALASEIGQATSVFSVSAAETAALGAAMRSMGVRAELGGSVVGRAMRVIEKHLTSGATKMQKLVAVTQMTESQLKATFDKNATVVFQKWIEGVGRLVKGGRTAESVLSEFGLAGEEVLKVLPTMAVNTKFLTEALKISNAEVQNSTALTKETIAASKSFSAQMQLTWNAIDSVASSIGSGLAPKIIEVAKEFRGWVKTNDDFLSQDLPTEIMDIAKGLGSVAKAFGTIVKYAGLRSIGETKLEGLVLISKGLLDKEKFLNATYLERQKMIDDYKKKYEETHGVIRRAINEEIDGYIEYKEAFKKGVKEIGSEVQNLSDLQKQSHDPSLFSDIAEEAKIAQANLESIVWSLGEVTEFSDIADGAKIAQENLEGMVRALGEVTEFSDINAFQNLADNVGHALASSVRIGIEDGFEGVGKNALNVLANGIENELSKAVSKAFQDSFSQVGTGMFSQVISPVVGSIAGGLAGAGIGALVGGLLGSSGPSEKQIEMQRLKELNESLKDAADAIKQNTMFLKNQYSSYTSGVQGLQTSFEDTIKAELGGTQWADSYGTLEDVSKFIQRQYDRYAQIHEEFSQFSGASYEESLSTFKSQAHPLYKFLFSAFDEFTEKLKNFQMDITQTAADLAESAGDAFRTEAEIQKRELNRTGTDLLVGLVESFKLEDIELKPLLQSSNIMAELFSSMDPALFGARKITEEYLTELDKLNSVEEITTILLRDLVEGSEAYNQVLKVSTSIQKASADEERVRMEEYNRIYSDMELYMRDLRGELSNVDKVLLDVNNRFDEYEKQLKNQKGVEVSLTTEREEAIRITKELYTETGKMNEELRKQAKLIEDSLTDSIFRLTMSSDDYSKFQIGTQYTDYISQITELGTGYEYLIDKASEWKKLSLEALEKQIKTTEAQAKASEYQSEADSWGSAVDSFSNLLDELKYGASSQLSVVEKMNSIQKELRGIDPNNLTDINRGQELWKKYLDLGKDRYQLPSAEWRSLVEGATADIVSLQDYAEAKQNELINLTREQNEIISKIEKWTQYTASNIGDTSYSNLPGYATGLNYVPREMPVRVHAQEAILNAQEAKSWRNQRYQSDGDVITVSFTVNASEQPEETARLARKEIEDYFDGRGRRKLQKIASGQ